MSIAQTHILFLCCSKTLILLLIDFGPDTRNAWLRLTTLGVNTHLSVYCLSGDTVVRVTLQISFVSVQAKLLGIPMHRDLQRRLSGKRLQCDQWHLHLRYAHVDVSIFFFYLSSAVPLLNFFC